MFRSQRARLFAAILVLPLLALATATGGSWLGCTATDALVSTCCCGDDVVGTPPAGAVATMASAACCDRVVRDVARAPAELAAGRTVAPRPLFAIGPFVAPLPCPAVAPASAPKTAPPWSLPRSGIVSPSRARS